ncbi:hypothetical protein KM043_007640 [Ampulex compressa]|nr:hypothetical protein KM043_007640 [Ampulex compressa]
MNETSGTKNASRFVKTLRPKINDDARPLYIYLLYFPIVNLSRFKRPSGTSFSLSAEQRWGYKALISESIKYPCSNCSSVFGQKRSLLTHLRYECGQPPRFKCPYCDLISKKTSNIQKHIRRKHEGSAVYVQDIWRLANLAV